MKRRKFFWLSSSLMLLCLTSCDSQEAADNIAGSVQDTVANALPNLYVALAQLGAFLVMVFVFFKFFYKPIKKRILARQEHVVNEIQDAHEKNLQAERELEVAKDNLKESHVKADSIIAEANKTAYTSAQEIIDDANRRADEIRKQAEKDAIEKQKEVERVAHDEIVTTAIAASKEVLGRELTNEDNDKVIEDFIEKMSKEEDNGK